MKHGAIVKNVQDFQSAVQGLGRGLPFTFQSYELNEPFSKWCHDWRENMPDNKSGVYIFRYPEDQIIYIGKATQNNLGAEIWGKFNKPRIISSTQKEFYKSPFLSSNNDTSEGNGVMEAVRKGEILFSILAVNPPYIASLLEVYLQIVYQNEKGALPILNRRIG